MTNPDLRSLFQINPRLFPVLLCFCLTVLYTSQSQAEMTDQQRQWLRKSASATTDAKAAYQSGNFETAGQKLQAAMFHACIALEGADQDVFEAAAKLLNEIEGRHSLLQLEGVVLPPFERPAYGEKWKSYVSEDVVEPNDAGREEAPVSPGSRRPARNRRTEISNTANSNMVSKDADSGSTSPGEEANGVSFVNQVAPILIQRCGNCHVTGNRGQFSMQSYAVLMKGPAAGTVVFPGDAIGSRLIETIVTGDMPRGGGKVPDVELQLLKDWVIQGAKFDGRAPGAPLTALATASTPNPKSNSQTMETASVDSSSMGTVSFAREIAPLLVANCNGCHLDAMQIRGGLNMNSFAQLMRGGDSGEVIMPGNGEGSLLVRKLKGLEGARMPAGGRPALPDDKIELISRWITEGAKLDQGTEDQNLRVMATESWAKNATHDELVERRRELAHEKYNLGVAADVRTGKVEFENNDCLVLGNVETEFAETIATAASDALERARTYIPDSTESNGPGAKFRGRVTIFVFNKRYDYSEFSKMVETRSIPNDWTEHWKYDGVDAYVSLLVDGTESEKQLSARLTAPLTSLVISELGQIPRWFSEGMGRAVAAKTVSRDFDGPLNWDKGLPEAVAVIKQPQELIEEKLPQQQADLIGYGVCRTMLERARRQQFNQLIKNLAAGNKFEDSFQSAFRLPLPNYIAACFGY